MQPGGGRGLPGPRLLSLSPPPHLSRLRGGPAPRREGRAGHVANGSARPQLGGGAWDVRTGPGGSLGASRGRARGGPWLSRPHACAASVGAGKNAGRGRAGGRVVRRLRRRAPAREGEGRAGVEARSPRDVLRGLGAGQGTAWRCRASAARAARPSDLTGACAEPERRPPRRGCSPVRMLGRGSELGVGLPEWSALGKQHQVAPLRPAGLVLGFPPVDGLENRASVISPGSRMGNRARAQTRRLGKPEMTCGSEVGRAVGGCGHLHSDLDPGAAGGGGRGGSFQRSRRPPSLRVSPVAHAWPPLGAAPRIVSQSPGSPRVL